MPYQIPECKIFFNPSTGYYGFVYRFEPPHHKIDTFRSIDDVLAWVDSHKEMIWERTSDADEDCIMVSRRYKSGSVLCRMSLSGPFC